MDRKRIRSKSPPSYERHRESSRYKEVKYISLYYFFKFIEIIEIFDTTICSREETMATLAHPHLLHQPQLVLLILVLLLVVTKVPVVVVLRITIHQLLLLLQVIVIVAVVMRRRCGRGERS